MTDELPEAWRIEVEIHQPEEYVEEKAWVPYQGPQGGEGWQDTSTGDVIYDDEPPGEAVGEELRDADDESILEAVEEVFDQESRQSLEEADLSDEELTAAMQELTSPEQLEEVAEAISENSGGTLDDIPRGELLNGIEDFWGRTARDRFEAMGEQEMLDELRDVTTEDDRERIAELSGSDDRPSPEEAVESLGDDPSGAEVVEALDLDYGEQTEFRELDAREQERLRDGLSAAYGEVSANEVYSTVGDWKRTSDDKAGARLEAIFMNALNLNGESYRDAEDTFTINNEEGVAQALAEASQKFVRSEYGDEMTVQRGISREAWKKYQESDDDTFEMSAMATVEAGNGDVASSFAEKNDTAVVEWTVPAEDVIFAMDALTSQTGINTMMEAEMQVKGGTVEADEVHEA